MGTLTGVCSDDVNNILKMAIGRTKVKFAQGSTQLPIKKKEKRKQKKKTSTIMHTFEL